MDWIEERIGCDALAAVGHRLGHKHEFHPDSRRIFQRMNSYAIYRITEDDPRAPIHDAGDPGLQLLSVDGGDDRNAGPA